MMVTELTPIFVDEIPNEIEEGKIYVSKKFDTAIHLCACGCGGKTVTPFKSGRWTLIEKDGTITLEGSIGNWAGENPYHAHYFIRENKIIWC